MKLIAALVIGLFTLIGATVVAQKNASLTSKITPTPTPTQGQEWTFEGGQAEAVPGEATFFVSPSTTGLEGGGNLGIDILLAVGNLNLSAGAMRLIITTGGTHLTPVDADSEKQGIQAQQSDVFRGEGWSFPINEIRGQNGKSAVDLAFVNLSPEGFSADGELVLATINFQSTPGTQVVGIEFDQDLSKLVAKNGNEVPLSFEGAVFSLK